MTLYTLHKKKNQKVSSVHNGAVSLLKIIISRIILLFFISLVQTVKRAKRMWLLKFSWWYSAGIIIFLHFVYKSWSFASEMLFCFRQAFIALLECSLFCTSALPSCEGVNVQFFSLRHLVCWKQRILNCFKNQKIPVS